MFTTVGATIRDTPWPSHLVRGLASDYEAAGSPTIGETLRRVSGGDMSDPISANAGVEDENAATITQGVSEDFVGDADYQAAFGERLSATLDVETWATGID